MTTREYRMGVRAERAAATRTRILAAARDLLADGAWHDTSLDAVATKAGVSRATVYRIFGDRHAVVEALTWHELSSAQLDQVDAAHAIAEPTHALHEVLRANCQMFEQLGDGLPLALELARRDPDVAAIVDATYHGRRHAAMERLAKRIVNGGVARSGWSANAITDTLISITSFEVFETLVTRRQHTPASAAERLIDLTTAFLAHPPPAASSRSRQPQT